MENKKYKTIMFIGTKGGAGKTTILANTAFLLAQNYNKKVGIIDLNIHSPLLPYLFSAEDRKVSIEKNKIIPVKILSNLLIISNEFFIKEKDMPIIMRKYISSIIVKQFVNDIDWEDYDYIFIDTPAGFSDEILTCIDEFKSIDYSVIVSTSQYLVRKEIEREMNFLKQYHIKSLGIVENMFSYKCKKCQTSENLFFNEKNDKLLEEKKISLLAKIPYNEKIFMSGELGITFVEKYKDSNDIRIFNHIANSIIKESKNEE